MPRFLLLGSILTRLFVCYKFKLILIREIMSSHEKSPVSADLIREIILIMLNPIEMSHFGRMAVNQMCRNQVAEAVATSARSVEKGRLGLDNMNMFV